MKKFIIVAFITVILLCLCACGNNTNESADGNTAEAPQQTGSAAENTESANEADVTSGNLPSRLKCTFEDGSVGYIKDLTDTVTTAEFASLLPMDITLSDWAGREYYTSRQLSYDEKDTQHTYAPGEFTYWCGGWITAYYNTDDDTVIEAGSVVIGMMDEVFLDILRNMKGNNISVHIEVDTII